jgi:hypothetical protein
VARVQGPGHAAYHAPSRKIARELADGVVADYGSELANAVGCFMDDFEACIAHLRLPITHRRATRTTDEIDKRFLASRHSRRTGVARASGKARRATFHESGEARREACQDEPVAVAALARRVVGFGRHCATKCS